ncbi:MAG: type I-F CRISPR-associated protein Csy1 [Lautropia sp.]|nr:type I-F CRISPR-associated protein Csy1 [Lautropia sp.]
MEQKSADEQEPPASSYREAIDRFLRDRLKERLEKVKGEGAEEAVTKERAKFERSVWLKDAARRVKQIRAVTHSLKPIHPDAQGTNLYVKPSDLPVLNDVGSHVLRTGLVADVVGNAAALDVYKLLKLEVNGKSLLAILEEGAEEGVEALDTDPVEAQALRSAFLGLLAAETAVPSSHTLAKQLYWLSGEDPSNDLDYELLAPLYATSLAHVVHWAIRDDRFGEAAKEAREARKNRRWHDGEVKVYPGLAEQKFGGTKPQNISQLNSERGGVNYLLSCAPPHSMRTELPLPSYQKTVFGPFFQRRSAVRRAVRGLREFLLTNPPENMATERIRERYLSTIIDELLVMAGEMRMALPPGWSCDETRFGALPDSEKLWLDPLRASLSGQEAFASAWFRLDWPDDVGRRFGLWLNQKLRRDLPVGDVEAREWGRLLMSEASGFRQQLRALGARINDSRDSGDLNQLPQEGGWL